MNSIGNKLSTMYIVNEKKLRPNVCFVLENVEYFKIRRVMVSCKQTVVL